MFNPIYETKLSEGEVLLPFCCPQHVQKSKEVYIDKAFVDVKRWNGGRPPIDSRSGGYLDGHCRKAMATDPDCPSFLVGIYFVLTLEQGVAVLGWVAVEEDLELCIETQTQTQTAN